MIFPLQALEIVDLKGASGSEAGNAAGMIFRFGQFELDTRLLELRCGGATVPIEPQVYDLLRLLIENRSRIVGKDEIIDRVWGGRIVSEAALNSRISAARRAVGDDGQRQAVIRTLPRRGFRFLAEATVEDDLAPARQDGDRPTQAISFCTARDGTRIAFARSGSGPVLVKSGAWLSHLEFDWESPFWYPLLSELSRSFTLIRYDQRGNGLSDWDVDDISFEAFVADLATVVDANGLDRFPLFGMSQGTAAAIAYAVRHPQRVSRLVLIGGFAQGRALRASAAEREQAGAYLTLMRHGWGKPGSQFLRLFSTLMLPHGTEEQIGWYADLQRRTTTPDNAIRIRQAIDRIDVTGLLPQVSVPTLVIHSQDDAFQPLDQARTLAAGIRGARFLPLESDNHLILPQEPSWPRYIAEIRAFLKAEDQSG